MTTGDSVASTLKAGNFFGKGAVAKVYEENVIKVENVRDEYDRKLRRIRWGSELPTGVLEKIKVYVATKRKVSVGDKISGRHGNKGVWG